MENSSGSDSAPSDDNFKEEKLKEILPKKKKVVKVQAKNRENWLERNKNVKDNIKRRKEKIHHPNYKKRLQFELVVH